MSMNNENNQKQKKDGRYCCTYQNIRFYGATQEEALEKRDEYIRKKSEGDHPCQSKNDNN